MPKSREDFQDLSQVRHVEAGDPVAEATTAQPTRALELRIQRLEQLIKSQIGSESGKLVIRDVDIVTGDDAVELHDLVFYNANTGLYEKAVAQVTAVTEGFLSNPTAFALGVVVAVNGAKGDVMIAGYETWSGEEHKQAMLESTETYQPGVPYFLSQREPGKITRFAPLLRIQVLLGTDTHFVLGFNWATPEAVENLYVSNVGMRPVGSLRLIGPGYDHNVIVGFDALERYNDTQQLWRSTKDSSISELSQFGYLVADAVVALQPDDPVYIAIEVAVSGAIKVYSAATLSELVDGGTLTYNPSTGLSALSDDNADSLRTYSVYDTANRSIGTLSFRFVSNDRSFPRRAVFKFPDDFQGWKHIHAPVSPRAHATVVGGKITGIIIDEASVGYNTAPTVVITDSTGIGAAAVANLDEWGSVVAVQMSDLGSGYTNPTITFDAQVTRFNVVNGGSGATAVATAFDGQITAVSLTSGGSGYLSNPDVVVVDTGGNGAEAVILAIARNGSVVEFIIADPGHDYVAPQLAIRPARQGEYQKTVPGEFQVTVSGGAVTSVALSGSGGYNYPPNAKVRIVGSGDGASVSAVMDNAGTVTGFVVNDGGSGYDDDTVALVDEKTPRLFVTGSEPTSIAEGQVTLNSMRLIRVDVDCSGIDYSSSITITPSGGLASGGVHAQLAADLDGEGRIRGVKIISGGGGYRSTPTLVIASGGNGNGAVLNAILGTEVVMSELLEAGSGYQIKPEVGIGVPLSHIEVEDSGTNYNDAPEVVIAPPDDPSGTQATAEAILGGGISIVTILDGGSGYDHSDAFLEITGGGGSGAVLQPLFKDGILVGVEVLDPGQGYTSNPSVAVVASIGSGASLSALAESLDGVIKINLTCPGSGYTSPPVVSIAASDGRVARAQAKLIGRGAELTADVSGEGGLRRTQAASMTQGNALQVSDYHDDLDDGSVAFARPINTAFYYNINADPNLKSRYPASPIEKAVFVLNGVEVPASVFNETESTAKDAEADVILSRKTVFWSGLSADGSPWDREFLHYVNEAFAGGRDNVIQNTGLTGDPDHWWRLWSNTFNYQDGHNRAWLHINRASRFVKSGRVVSIGVLAPLKAVDMVSGVDSRNDGSPISGQVLITMDGQTSILSTASEQIDLTSSGDLKAIYANTTGRPVVVSSVILHVTFQLNSGGTPTATHSAQVTIGTQEGGYSDMVGVAAPVPVRLFAQNQFKEMIPDSDSAAPLLMPNQKLYLRVVLPAARPPIARQLAVARIKGHVL